MWVQALPLMTAGVVLFVITVKKYAVWIASLSVTAVITLGTLAMSLDLKILAVGLWVAATCAFVVAVLPRLPCFEKEEDDEDVVQPEPPRALNPQMLARPSSEDRMPGICDRSTRRLLSGQE